MSGQLTYIVESGAGPVFSWSLGQKIQKKIVKSVKIQNPLIPKILNPLIRKTNLKFSKSRKKIRSGVRRFCAFFFNKSSGTEPMCPDIRNPDLSYLSDSNIYL
jgi:hypothetical protein